MTVSIAITGKSGSGKTTLTKAFLNLVKENYPDKSVLLFDNDLTCELGHSFGLDIRNTIYGIRSGKHEYKTGIPSGMTKQEYIEWALQDIIVELDERTDIIASWLIGSKDCRCPITYQLNDAIVKLINQYDIVIFDCEFDLKYLNQLVDYPVDATVIVALPTEESVHLAQRIEEFSEKYACGKQLGVILNKVKKKGVDQEVADLLNKYNLDILGVIPYDKELKNNGVKKESQMITEELREIFFRMNLPQEL